ncbi:MAG: helicase-exonuclease AddAB subunit AddA [Clostridia bacterium]|nr:helicase-exonuclease AddAB subunit AddA [Clostridia bacterium]
MQWTEMQEKAVNYPVNDILVTAAAGSGKTQVLTGRILNRITKENADISKMLVITFTNAAAAEMRSRISKKITEAVSENPKSRHLRRQLALVGSSDISTIHSFCLNVLKSYFYISDIDPSFKIAENYDVKIMQAEALSEAMDYFYDTGDERFLSSVDLLCGSKNDTAVSEMADKLWKFSSATPFPEEWLLGAKASYESISDNFGIYADILLNKATSLLKIAADSMTSCIEYIRAVPEYESKVDIFMEDEAFFTSLLSASHDWNSIYEATGYKLKSNMKRFSRAEAEWKAPLKRLIDRAKNSFDQIKEYINLPLSEALEYTISMVPSVSSIIDVALKAMEIYSEKKAEKNVLDFNDLEHLTIKILTDRDEDGNIIPSHAANEIRDRYSDIFVDEYQDTNDVQETILKMISGESKGKPNLFMVGDMKQSIYKFRMTSPKKIFGEKSDSFTDVTKASDGDKHIKIALSQNFRSRREILDAVNSVFDLLMTKEAGEVEYTGTERLDCGSKCYTEPIEEPACSFNILVAENGTSSKEAHALQAGFVAKRIRELMEKGTRVYDKDISGFRPLSYKDIAILLRAPKNQAAVFEEALRSNNIPVYTDLDAAFFDCIEVQLLLSLLRITDNPLQDISLVCALRSPIFNFDENLLATLALKRKPYLYEAVKEAAFDAEKPNKKCLRFVLMLEKWRKEASFSSVGDFLSMLIEETHFKSYVSAMPDSDAHLTNIDLLQTMAKKSDESSYKGLFNFLRYVDKMSLGEDGITADSVSSSLDAVRILSIHKSKGLEFPVVFLARADSAFSSRDYSGDILLHKEFGIGISAFTPERTKFRIPVNTAISSILKDECISEELRVLYVALTRAREHLEIITSEVLGKNEDHFIIPERDTVVSPEDVLSCNSYADWLLMASLNNRHIRLNIINNPSFSEDSDAENDYGGVCMPEPIDCTKDISSVLEYSYPYEHLKSVKSKYSVSELKSGLAEDAAFPLPVSGTYVPTLKTPGFLNSDKVFTSAEKGSIIHYVLQNIDFRESDISSQLDSMNLTENERDAVDVEFIRSFLLSPLCERMKKASEIHREEPFTFTCTLSEITKNPDDDSPVLIQGIIDCYFIENGEIILLDYKTDRNVTPEILKQRYGIQLDIYAEALKKRYNMPVREKLIYSFSLNEVIHIQKGTLL